MNDIDRVEPLAEGVARIDADVTYVPDVLRQEPGHAITRTQARFCGMSAERATVYGWPTVPTGVGVIVRRRRATSPTGRGSPRRKAKTHSPSLRRDGYPIP